LKGYSNSILKAILNNSIFESALLSLLWDTCVWAIQIMSRYTRIHSFPFLSIFFPPGEKKSDMQCYVPITVSVKLWWYDIDCTYEFWIFSSQQCCHYFETHVPRTYKSCQCFIELIPFFVLDLFVPKKVWCYMQLYVPIITISVKLWWYHIDCRCACMSSHSFLFFRSFFLPGKNIAIILRHMCPPPCQSCHCIWGGYD